MMNDTDIQAIFDASPFIAFLGLKVMKLDTATQ